MAAIQDLPQDEPAAVLTPTDARQGLRGRHVAWILGISMVLIVIGFTALYLLSARHLASGGGGQTTVESKLPAADNFHAPPSQPRQSENPQTTPGITPGVGSNGKAL